MFIETTQGSRFYSQHCKTEAGYIRRQRNYIIVINIKRVRLRHWDKEGITEKSEQLGPSPLFRY
jgi:hypothetical protein